MRDIDIEKMNVMMENVRYFLNKLARAHDINSPEMGTLLFNMLYQVLDQCKKDKSMDTMDLIKEMCDNAIMRNLDEENDQTEAEKANHDTGIDCK